MNVRMVNAVFEDRGRPDFDAEANTAEFLRALASYRDHGVQAFTISLQGGMPGYEGAANSAFEPDGSLRDDYLGRVRQVIESCDRLGLVVILSCYYQRQDQLLRDEAAVKAGVVNVARWVRDSGFGNVVLEIANEFPHGGFDHPLLRTDAGQAELIALARQTAPDVLVSTSGMGDGKLSEHVAEACDFLLIHLNGVPLPEIGRRIDDLKRFGKPVVCNEDDKLGEEGVQAAELAVAHGASWGLMVERVNQHFPFTFRGAADDPIVYAQLRRLTSSQVFPGKSWVERPPREVGLDRTALDRFAEYLGGRGCVVRHGYLAYTWGDAAQRGDVASACKPWYTHFLLAAIEEGKLKGLDEPVAAIEPRLSLLNASRDFKDRGILWRHLSSQTSCYGVAERPGEAFDYNDFNMALFFDTLFLKVYRTTWEKVDQEVLRPKLTDLIGCQDEPSFMAFGPGDRPGRLAISVRDFARFGLLYLRQGNWNGRRLLRAEHVQLATSRPLTASFPRTAAEEAEMVSQQRNLGGGKNQTDHMGSYSFAWWTNGTDRDGKRHWPGAPLETYGAFGHGGMRAMVVIPSLDLVVCWNDAQIEGRDKENLALAVVTSATKPIGR